MPTVTSLAAKLALIGNVGISPFYVIFMMSLISSYNGDTLNLNSSYETIITSPTFRGLSALAATMELAGKSIPFVDGALDAAQTFLVPLIAVFVCLATGATDDIEERRLEGVESSFYITVLQGLFVAFGALTAVAVHLTKMLIRTIGAGWLTTVLTVFEILFCTFTILAVAYVQTAALLIGFVFFCCFLRLVRGAFAKLWEKRKKKKNRFSFRKKSAKESLLL